MQSICVHTLIFCYGSCLRYVHLRDSYFFITYWGGCTTRSVEDIQLFVQKDQRRRRRRYGRGAISEDLMQIWARRARLKAHDCIEYL